MEPEEPDAPPPPPSGGEPDEDDDDRKGAGLWAAPGAAAFTGTVVGGIAAAPDGTEALAPPTLEMPAAAPAPGSPSTAVHGSPSTMVHGSPTVEVHGSPPTTVRTKGKVALAVGAGVAVVAVIAGVAIVSGGDDNTTVAATTPTTLLIVDPAVSEVATTEATTPDTAPVDSSPADTAPIESSPQNPFGFNGSVTFEVSGDVAAGGELTLMQQTDVEEGRLFTFATLDGQEVLQIALLGGGELVITYSHGGTIVGGANDVGCTIELTQDDAELVAGTFACVDVPGISGGSTPITASVSGSFQAEP